MAVVATIAGAGLLYVMTQQKQVEKKDDNPHNNLLHKARVGELDTQQNLWTREKFRPYWHGSKPFARNQPVPSLTTSRRVMEEQSLSLTNDYKETIRRNIEDTEWDDVPFRGERADQWAGRDRRRLPIINHPNSEISWVTIGEDAASVDNFPPARPMGKTKHLNLARINHPLPQVSTVH